MSTGAEKKPWIETPLVWSRRLSEAAGCNIYLKLENVQPSGSFKSRGIGNFLQAQLARQQANSASSANGAPSTTHFFCSSGGNAGLACVHAAVTLGCPATIVVPMSTSDYMISKLQEAGATEVVQIGASWYEADKHLNEELLPKARESGQQAVYVPPFDHPDIWTGNSTVLIETVGQLPVVQKHYPVDYGLSNNGFPDAIICSVGGGGLFNGIMQGINRHIPPPATTRVVAVETVGADSLAQSVAKDELITLPAITSIATTLGARTVSETAFQHARDRKRVSTAVLTDKEAIEACKRFADDERILVEPSCGVALAVCYTGKLREYLPDLRPESNVVVIVCGGSGLSLDILNRYVKEYLD